MKRLLTFSLCLFLCLGIARAQTTIYTQNFNSGSAPEWTLQSSELSGTTSLVDNQWTINNTYTGGILAGATPSEPAQIVGYPHSYYMHIYSAVGAGVPFSQPANDNFDAGGTGDVYVAAMTTPQNTTGYTNVYFSFWWLCNGDAACDGNVYYSTNGGTTWTQITGVNFYGSSTWAVDSIHLAAFDNQASLEFAFTFTDGDGSGNDPAFGIDDVSITGVGGSTAPVASFTTTATTACQDSCITFTSTSTGTITSVSWNATPASPTITSATSASTSICFPTAGTYTVSLTATNGSGSNTATSVINVTPTPHPAITKTGHMLSVSGAYTGYQWYDASTAITGATNASYTYTVGGTYSVEVDSAGCPGFSNVENTTGIANIGSTMVNYWISQANSSSLSLNASVPLDDALTIGIYDVAGRKILDDIWNAGSYTKQINGLSIPTGLYIIKLSNNYTSTVIKWLKP